MITANLVKELREKTGAGMMECKKILMETDGNMEKAVELLRERGITKAEKKADRIAAEGIVACYVTEDKKTGVILEVNAETDFVAKNEQFKKFVENTAKHIAINNPKEVEYLLNQIDSITGKTIKDILTENIATIGENITIRRFVRFQTNGLIQSYIHGEGKIGVLTDFEKADEILAKDICMQIAAAKPEYLNKEEVPAEIVNYEMGILKIQAINEGKSEQIAEKIVQGRIQKFYSEKCLLDQAFVKDPDITIQKLLNTKEAKINKFVRFEKGEGLEKREENFAEEVAKQIK